MNPKDKISSQLKQNIVYKCSCPQENCNISYIGESSRCLENRIKEHSSHVTSAVDLHSVSNSHPIAHISHFKIIDQDNKQFTREAREAIHIRINDPALNCTTEKMSIPEINNLLGADGSTNKSKQMLGSDYPQSHTHLTFQATGSPEQYVWQIK